MRISDGNLFKFKSIHVCSRLLNHSHLLNTITSSEKIPQGFVLRHWKLLLCEKHMTKGVQEHELQKTRRKVSIYLHQVQNPWEDDGGACYSEASWFFKIRFASESSSRKDAMSLTSVPLPPWSRQKILFLLQESSIWASPAQSLPAVCCPFAVTRLPLKSVWLSTSRKPQNEPHFNHYLLKIQTFS